MSSNFWEVDSPTSEELDAAIDEFERTPSRIVDWINEARWSFSTKPVQVDVADGDYYRLGLDQLLVLLFNGTDSQATHARYAIKQMMAEHVTSEL